MPIRDDILAPIPGDNPSGENLRYAAVYDKLKELRRHDDELAQGDWQRERKVADSAQVIKLTNELIATKSKDLQLAAWLTEALLSKEGYAGLHGGLSVIKGIIEGFWDTCYPELDDGDAEFRAAPIDWVGQYLGIPAKRVPLVKGGYDLLKYQESRKVGYEADSQETEHKTEVWQVNIAEGKLTADDFDKALSSTSVDFYVKVVGDLDAALQDIEDLQPICEDKFGDVAPSFSKLRDALSEVRHTANGFLIKKGGGPKAEAEPEEEEPTDEAAEAASWSDSGGGAAAAPARARKVTSAEPVDREDAGARIAAVAAFIRREDPFSPAPYLLLRGYRWGELRAPGPELDPTMFEPPDTEVRQQLKRLALEGQWNEVVEVAETAMAKPCGRAWLDLQRYVVTACENTGAPMIAEAIKSELRALLTDYPDLVNGTLMDDTPTANSETQAWIKESVGSAPASAAPEPIQYYTPPAEDSPSDSVNGEGTPDAFQLAMEAARSGRQQEAVEILAVEIGRQNSGRSKFQRKLQLAQLCMSLGQEVIASSILEELASVIDRHQLEQWESADLIAQALSMLYCTLKSREGDDGTKQKLYARICRLDPVQALTHAR